MLNSDNKIELHLNGKEHYSSLPEFVKTDIKRGFIWGRQRGAWVSRSKDTGIPFSMRSYSIPLNQVQERKEYIDAREKRIERTEHRAERFEGYAEARIKEAESLQSEFNKLCGDWSWITQPNVGTSGGRRFSRQREKVVSRYEKGFESMKVAEYHRERAQIAKISASESELKSESYLLNRVKEGEKDVRKFERFTQTYADKLATIDAQPDDWKIWLKARMNYYETAFEKLEFFQDALNELTIQRKESGKITHVDIDERIKGIKSEVKKYLKEKYGIDLLKFTSAFGQGIKRYYYIKTAQPLPVEYHSGWASDCAAQIPVAKIIKDIDEFYKS